MHYLETFLPPRNIDADRGSPFPMVGESKAAFFGRCKRLAAKPTKAPTKANQVKSSKGPPDLEPQAETQPCPKL